MSRDPLDAVAEVVRGFGVRARPLREAVTLLTERRMTLDGLVRECALPRRTVETLLRAAEEDLDRSEDGFAIRKDRVEVYRGRFSATGTRTRDPFDDLLNENADLVAQLRADIEAAPAARQELDHVAATAETVVRRALWLDATFDLAGARLLCVGDHDLSCIAACAIVRDLTAIVVDVDERLLEYIDDLATRRGLDIRCRYADLRFGIPDTQADVVLTDPPYTPDGVQLFLGRGLQGLRDHANGRLVLAYGFSQPALGMKVQRAIQELDLVTEAILPAFNRYHGAQAVGSASDLYVCRPTARTWQVLDRKLARVATNIYTHGPQSIEAKPEDPEATTDLTADPGPWLLRTLLAVNADHLSVLVPNNHADLATERAQRELRELVAPKYTLRLRRSTPTPKHAIVEATAAPPEGIRHDLLSRAHGKVGNVWREAIVRRNETTKNEARELITRTAGQADWLDARLIDLPRHMIRTVLTLADLSVTQRC